MADVTALLAGLRQETPPAVPYDMAKASKPAVSPAEPAAEPAVPSTEPAAPSTEAAVPSPEAGAETETRST
jgi:hypothetical protein